jgi:hypothetical protein
LAESDPTDKCHSTRLSNRCTSCNVLEYLSNVLVDMVLLEVKIIIQLLHHDQLQTTIEVLWSSDKKILLYHICRHCGPRMQLQDNVASSN